MYRALCTVYRVSYNVYRICVSYLVYRALSTIYLIRYSKLSGLPE